eukprot:tig00001388_g8579.t1
MVRITEELLRKRSEHNDGCLSTLKEITLHQFDIEKIELFDKLCRGLEIIYLQNNLVGKLENLNRLKALKYLNMAVNNITKIEGLQGCESLEKLDLTCNFVDVDELASLESLKHNIFLRELHMVGNPCTNFEGYRDFVAAVLPQLRVLDGKEIMKSDRIQAVQKLPEIRAKLAEAAELCRQEKALKKQQQPQQQPSEAGPSSRSEGAAEAGDRSDGGEGTSAAAEASAEAAAEASAEAAAATGEGAQEGGEKGEEGGQKDNMYQDLSGPSAGWSPEARWADHLKAKAEREEQERIANEARTFKEPKKEKRGPELSFTEEGLPRQRNDARWDFSINEDAARLNVVVDIAFPKFLDTSLIEVDVHPRWLKCAAKGKVICLTWDEDVVVAKAKVLRSTTTGHLTFTLPKVNATIRAAAPPKEKELVPKQVAKPGEGAEEAKENRRELRGPVDVRNIVPRADAAGSKGAAAAIKLSAPQTTLPPELDNPEVPPLE